MGIYFAKEKLFHSIDAGNYEDVLRVLEKFPSIIDQPFDKNRLGFPLLRACQQGRHQIVELLIQLKADINIKNCNFYTPLFFAA